MIFLIRGLLTSTGIAGNVHIKAYQGQLDVSFIQSQEVRLI